MIETHQRAFEEWKIHDAFPLHRLRSFAPRVRYVNAITQVHHIWLVSHQAQVTAFIHHFIKTQDLTERFGKVDRKELLQHFLPGEKLPV